jgi:tetratricopeptide (TPR) repeat protein
MRATSCTCPRTSISAWGATPTHPRLTADQSYLERTKPPGYYPIYINHNYGFLAYSTSMQGRSAEALAASRKSAQAMPTEVVCGMPGMDFFLSEPLLVMVRFGRWDAILAEPKPDAKYQVLTALWHHAQGMARAARGELPAAREHVAAIRAIAAKVPEDQLAGLNTGRSVVELAAKVVEARAADSEQRADAVALWQEAVALEDKLSYSEPSDWFYPTRHYLGAALLDRGQAREAEAVYRADLERNPKNGWALYGVYRALDAQKKKSAALRAEQEFKAAWKDADIAITRSAY